MVNSICISIEYIENVLEVKLNDEVTLKINPASKDNIKAKEIYDSLKYKYGNHYILKELDVNPNKKEYKFIKPFFDLYADLISKINEIDVKDELTKDISLKEENPS